MKFLTPLRTLVIAGFALAVPATSLAKNRGSYCAPRGGVYLSSGYRGGYSAPRPYCPPVAYRPYYARPYSYGGYYGGPAISVGFSTAPAYYGGAYYNSYPTRTVYRGVAVRESVRDNDDLSVDVQRALARRGFYRGEIDGDIGPGSRAAIRSYQYDRGLEVTGRIDGSLLRSLGLS